MAKQSIIIEPLEEKADKIAEIIDSIKNQHGLTYEQASEAVRIAAMTQLTDTFIKMTCILDEVTDAMSFNTGQDG